MSRPVQYLIINQRILDLGWNKGAVIAQACHAAVAVVMSHLTDPDVQAYCSPTNLSHMTKIVLKASSEEFDALRDALTDVPHYAWVEEPEGICSCIALKPAAKTSVESFVKHLKLYR